MGVTAVDARHRVLIEACRGKHLDLAAPGADMSAATLGQSGQTDAFASVRGTSFAAPIVAGLLARTLARPYDECSRRARKCRDLNDRNGILVGAQIKRIEGMLGALTGAGAEPPGYGPRGQAGAYAAAAGSVLSAEA